MTQILRRGSILIAEDDPDDQLLIRRAMEDNGVKNEVCFVRDGQELVDHLGKNTRSQNAGEPCATPCLILMDLNMPRMDGRAALKVVKGDPDFKKIPVVILTTSRAEEDVANSYRGGANSFFTKPGDYTKLVALVDLLKVYWLQTAILPPFGNS